MGDRWLKNNLMASSYVWLPLSISGTSVSMKNLESWVPTANFAAWQTRPAEASYEGEKATYGGKARNVECATCSSKMAAGYLGGPDRGSLSFSGVRSEVDGVSTIRIRYLNGDTSPRYATVRVNGDEGRKIAFLPAKGDPLISTLHARLKKGDNTISFEGVGTGWGPDIDRLIVPTQ